MEDPLETIDPDYEFDAPMAFDFATMQEEENVDKWFDTKVLVTDTEKNDIQEEFKEDASLTERIAMTVAAVERSMNKPQTNTSEDLPKDHPAPPTPASASHKRLGAPLRNPVRKLQKQSETAKKAVKPPIKPKEPTISSAPQRAAKKAPTAKPNAKYVKPTKAVPVGKSVTTATKTGATKPTTTKPTKPTKATTTTSKTTTKAAVPKPAKKDIITRNIKKITSKFDKNKATKDQEVKKPVVRTAATYANIRNTRTNTSKGNVNSTNVNLVAVHETSNAENHTEANNNGTSTTSTGLNTTAGTSIPTTLVKKLYKKLTVPRSPKFATTNRMNRKVAESTEERQIKEIQLTNDIKQQIKQGRQNVLSKNISVTEKNARQDQPPAKKMKSNDVGERLLDTSINSSCAEEVDVTNLNVSVEAKPTSARSKFFTDRQPFRKLGVQFKPNSVQSRLFKKSLADQLKKDYQAGIIQPSSCTRHVALNNTEFEPIKPTKLNESILYGPPTGIPSVPPMKLTLPMSPAFATKKRFALKTIDTNIKEEADPDFSCFKALPNPSYPKQLTPKQTYKKLTEPEPFTFKTEERIQMKKSLNGSFNLDQSFKESDSLSDIIKKRRSTLGNSVDRKMGMVKENLYSTWHKKPTTPHSPHLHTAARAALRDL